MSQETSVKKEIGGKPFEMYMLPPIKSNDLLIDALTMVGPSLGPVFDTMAAAMKADGIEALLESELPEGFFERVTVRLFADLDKRTLNRMIETFKEVTLVDGVFLEKTFDDLFAGAIDDMYRWIAWGISVQWGKSLSALMSGAGAAVKSALASQSQKD